jgi:hypothetical protein
METSGTLDRLDTWSIAVLSKTAAYVDGNRQRRVVRRE